MSDYQPKSPRVSFKKQSGSCEFPKCHKATRQGIQCEKIPRNQASASHCRANSFNKKKFTSICTIWTSTAAWQPGGTTASITNKHYSTVNSLPTYTFWLFIFASETTVLFSDTLLDWLDLLSDPFHGSFGIKAEAKVKGTAGTQM